LDSEALALCNPWLRVRREAINRAMFVREGGMNLVRIFIIISIQYNSGNLLAKQAIAFRIKNLI
jgi:hypothetical protein